MREPIAGRIRAATESDIPLIEAWLHMQPIDAESLRMNWKITLGVYQKRGMLVFECVPSGEPAAYFWGSLNSTDSILEVRHDMRGRGIGSAIVAHLVESSENAGEGLLRIECAPSSSAAFWETMGFATEYDRGHTHAKRVLQISRVIPFDTVPVDVTVRFLPGEACHADAELSPLAEYRPAAGRDAFGTIWLAERVASFRPGPYSEEGDLVAEVIVDRKRAFLGKAKHAEAGELGFEQCLNGYAIERISWSRL